MDVKNNIRHFQKEVSLGGGKLVAVSKTQPVEKLQEAYDAGQRIFGENKVQELVLKAAQLPTDIAWHYIGHLQTNKVKMLVPVVSLIHSVDSLKLLDEIEKEGRKINRCIPILLQVYIAQEETKFGLDEPELFSLLDHLTQAPRSYVAVRGLMGMASLTEDRSSIRSEFRALRSLYEKIKLRQPAGNITMEELSMGMSADYSIALEEGSTLVRIGTALFGERQIKTKTA